MGFFSNNIANISNIDHTNRVTHIYRTSESPMSQQFDDALALPLVAACDEIITKDRLQAVITSGDTERPLAIQGLDLCDMTESIVDHDWPQTVFLGCPMTERAAAHARTSGATVFPPFGDIPYNPYRGALYSPAELRTGGLDEAIYRHQAVWRDSPPPPILEALAQRIHDHAIDNALTGYLEDHPRVVAIMGGHSLKRDAQTYRTVALIARALTQAGHLVVTGGGPGAMEAGNLGAWLSTAPQEALDDAIDTLRAATDFSTQAYLDASIEVVERYPEGAESLAIPTWFYGHEPTNDFATAVAKYFSNSIREDGLLAIATHGVVYTPGAAGTVQEVFMDATQNHYDVFGVISPMVFVDSAYWADDRLGAPKLLRQLAGDRPYSDLIGVFDSPDDVVNFIESHPPIIDS